VVLHNLHTLNHQRDQHPAQTGAISVGVPLIKQINAAAEAEKHNTTLIQGSGSV
jgi:hypothetical protein